MLKNLRFCSARLQIVLPLVLMLTLVSALALSVPIASQAAELSDEQLRILFDSKVETGVAWNAIPPVYKPVFNSVADASLSLETNEDVFILEQPGDVRIYPRSIMVWHEVVNDRVGGSRVSITYSPLSGSVVGFMGKAGRYDTVFGNTGTLLNANTILFDHATNSLWPQLLGIAIDGPLKGANLESFPLVWTTWGRARTLYPDARVLSRATGKRRPYGKDPYGSYNDPASVYRSDRITYPVLHRDKRLHPKTPILGVKLDTARIAVVKAALRKKLSLDIDAGVMPLTAIWDADLDTVRVFDRRVQGKPLTFTYYQGKLFDRETNSEWTPQGQCTYGLLRDERLKPVNAYDAMWFAWSAFYPDSMIYR